MQADDERFRCNASSKKVHVVDSLGPPFTVEETPARRAVTKVEFSSHPTSEFDDDMHRKTTQPHKTRCASPEQDKPRRRLAPQPLGNDIEAEVKGNTNIPHFLLTPPPLPARRLLPDDNSAEADTDGALVTDLPSDGASWPVYSVQPLRPLRHQPQENSGPDRNSKSSGGATARVSSPGSDCSSSPPPCSRGRGSIDTRRTGSKRRSPSASEQIPLHILGANLEEDAHGDSISGRNSEADSAPLRGPDLSSARTAKIADVAAEDVGAAVAPAKPIEHVSHPRVGAKRGLGAKAHGSPLLQRLACQNAHVSKTINGALGMKASMRTDKPHATSSSPEPRPSLTVNDAMGMKSTIRTDKPHSDATSPSLEPHSSFPGTRPSTATH